MTSPMEHEGESNTELLARLLDLRTIVGLLFLIFGILVTPVGLSASDADIAKADGINISLWMGLFMLVVAAVFIVWMLLVPPELTQGHQVTEDDLPEQMRHHH
ncbi:MAG TPA: hypothetical protein VFJ97_04640 [Dermatophilaceae bacterium]|nr:hypothetical protein [Dermatophilaceae bacterium]